MGAAALTRLHLYLILEIALLYGKDIDDQARVPEMLAVVAATGAAAGVPVLMRLLGLHPLLSIPVAGLTASTVTHLIGHTAIRYYGAADYRQPLLPPPHPPLAIGPAR
jgi:hypothetical protein